LTVNTVPQGFKNWEGVLYGHQKTVDDSGVKNAKSAKNSIFFEVELWVIGYSTVYIFLTHKYFTFKCRKV